tara:strand:- start:1164 stop:2120 length:957 start_codon:yes stop_codon:yes gene_type:complete
MDIKNITLAQHLDNLKIDSDLKSIINIISKTCYEISEVVRVSKINSLVGKTGKINVQGEQVEKLDQFSNDLLMKNLSDSGKVFLMGSEEIESVIIPSPNNQEAEYVVVFDPLDGSSNIDVSVTIGTIFGIYKKINNDQNDESNLLQKGKDAIVAGYTVYGSSSDMCVSMSEDTSIFSFDENGIPFLTIKNISYGNEKIYSINESKWNNFSDKDKRWLKSLKSGANGNYTSRYVGSLVADFHRNLIKGGIFSYPADSKTGLGKLRLIYECNPLSLIAKNANGFASDGEKNILNIKPDNLHQRVGFYVGNNAEMHIYENT